VKRKLHFCDKCRSTYVAEVNNGTCLAVVNVIGDTVERCYGTIRPIDYELPKTLPGQIDLEDELAKLPPCTHPHAASIGMTGDESDWWFCPDCNIRWRE
jgi:hypothetical protein